MFNKKLRSLRHRVKKLLFKPYLTKVKVGGQEITLHIDDLFAKNVYDFDRQWPEMEWFLSQKLPEGLILDVGANQGLTSVFYALTHRNRQVATFEPNRFNNVQILKNLSLNSISNVCLYPYAAGKETGKIRMSEFSNSGRLVDERSKGYETVVQRLDAVVSTDVAFLKIDVEGMELDVLQGASGLFDRNRPILDVEIHLFTVEQRIQMLESIIEFINQWNYSIEFVVGYQGEVVPWDSRDTRLLVQLSRENTLNALCLPR